VCSSRSVRVVGAADSLAVPSAHVAVMDAAGKTIAEGRTGVDGLYRISEADSAYRIRVSAFGYYRYSAEILPASTCETRQIRLTRMNVGVDTIRVIGKSLTLVDPAGPPADLAGDWKSQALETLPIDPGDVSSVAALEPGVIRIAPGLVSVSGQAPSENRTTVDGGSFGLIPPSEGLRGVRVVVDSYDPAAGQALGGRFVATTQSGSNAWGMAASSYLDDPTLRAAPVWSSGLDDRLVRIGAGGGGPIRRNRTFLFSALEFSNRRGPAISFNPTDPAALDAFSIHPDSARRLDAVFHTLGFENSSSSGTVLRQSFGGFVRLDHELAAGQSFTARLAGRWIRHHGVDGSPLSLGSGRERNNRDLGLQLQWTTSRRLWSNELGGVLSSGQWGGNVPG